MVMRKLFVLFLLLLSGIMGYASDTFRNPVIYADVPDMSVIRVGDDFYMISTTMHLMPGAPVMTSRTKDIFIRQLTRAVSGSWYLVHRIFMMHLFSSMMMVKCIFFTGQALLLN